MGKEALRFSDRNLILAAEWGLLRELLSRYQEEVGRDLQWMGLESWANRERLAAYLTGRRTRLPAALADDLKHVAALSSKLGAMLLHHHAREAHLPMALPEAQAMPDLGLHAASVALWTYLHHRPVFEHVRAWLTEDSRQPADEYLGEGTGAIPTFTFDTQTAFERRARRHLTAGRVGRSLRFHWYPGADGIGLLIDHGGAAQTALPDGGSGEGEELGPHLDTLLYESQTGYLRVTGCAEMRRRLMRAVFAELLLRRPGFFERPGSLGLHLLDPDVRTSAPSGLVLDSPPLTLLTQELPEAAEAPPGPSVPSHSLGRFAAGRDSLVAYLRRHLVRTSARVEGPVAGR